MSQAKPSKAHIFAVCFMAFHSEWTVAVVFDFFFIDSVVSFQAQPQSESQRERTQTNTFVVFVARDSMLFMLLCKLFEICRVQHHS